jgi:hypothetical protein
LRISPVRGHRQLRVAAIRVLLRLDRETKLDGDELSAFDRLGLYDDEFSVRQRRKAAQESA